MKLTVPPQIHISAIAAVSPSAIIGIGNNMPWIPPKIDMMRFRAITMHKPLIMGRRTFQSIKISTTNRPHIVLSRTKYPDHNNITFVNNLQDAINLAAEYNTEIIVTGGSQIYAALLPVTSTIYLTCIPTDPDEDPELPFVYFPEIDPDHWGIESQTNSANITFKTLRRIR